MSLKKIDYPVAIFLLSVMLIAIVATPTYLYFFGFDWRLWLFAALFAAATNMSITAGYHRLFAHRSFEAHPLLQWLLLFFSTSAWQGSALTWVSGHRTHHKFQDKERDPYSINEGFFHAHFGWMIFESEHAKENNISDLLEKKSLVFQDRFYVLLAITAGFIFPTLVGAALGAPLGGFLIAGFLRIALTQQSTWFVNSLCHCIGRKPYAAESSARDSFFVALLTHGEGYHNYHHRFQIDYRNGVRWWNWDPTKWLIFSAALVGLAKKLRRISNEEILRARLQVESLRLASQGISFDRIEALKTRVLEAAEQLKQVRLRCKTASNERVELIKTELRIAKIELQFAKKVWRTYLKSQLPA